MYNDKNLTCADCGQEFVFTASEQDFYAQRGFTEPRRCPSCRASRKAARNASGGAGGSSYGGYGAGGGYSRRRWLQQRWRRWRLRRRRWRRRLRPRPRSPRDVQRHLLVTAASEAQVPFRPTSGKPVYCSDCFRSQRGGSPLTRFILSARADERPAEPAA